MRNRMMLRVILASLLGVATTQLDAKTVLVPGSKPTRIEPGRQPFTFATPPTLRTSFSRDEPFLEGELAYGYGGRVTTPVMRGDDAVVPAGAAAYGVPMRTSGSISEQLVWCALTKEGSPKIGTVCLFDQGMGFGGNDSLMTTSAYVLDTDPYGGGDIVPAPFDAGAPVRVRYYVQNLGKIARVKGQILVGGAVANQWGYIFGDIGRGSQPAERLLSVGGGVVGISPDPAAKDRYVLRIITPLRTDGGVPLGEVRNDSKVMGAQP